VESLYQQSLIANDLKTSQENVNWSVALYLFTASLGGLVWGIYSGYYGRRPMYLIALPMYTIASIGVALADDLLTLLLSRSIQGLATSCFMTSGGATITDIFRVEERGRAMGVYWALILSGPAIAPVIGAAVSHYFSWRYMQLILGLGAFISLLFVIFFLPETIHPGQAGYEKDAKGKARIVILNPLESLKMLASPVLLLSALVGAFSLVTDYYLLIPLSYVMKEYHNVDNELIVGAVFLPVGLGNMVGALVAGWLCDYYIIKGERSRGGIWFPEDRLRAALLSIAFITPLSVIGYGLSTQYVRGYWGIVFNMFWLFVNGIGVDGALGPCNVYAMDIFINRSAEASAVAGALRLLLSGSASGFALPLIKTLGIANSAIPFAVLCWFSTILLLVNIKYGKQLRDWKDMGYTLRK